MDKQYEEELKNEYEKFLCTESGRKWQEDWEKLSRMFVTEREKGVYDAETKLPQTITTYGPGYIDKENEVIVGLQTDAPLKRGIFPKGGIRMVESALKAYGYELDPSTKEIYTKYRKTSIMMVLPHKPGALYKVLARLYTLGINVTKLESRPIPDREFEFMFYFDLDTSIYSEEYVQLMCELDELCEEFKYLGSYTEVI